MSNSATSDSAPSSASSTELAPSDDGLGESGSEGDACRAHSRTSSLSSAACTECPICSEPLRIAQAMPPLRGNDGRGGDGQRGSSEEAGAATACSGSSSSSGDVVVDVEGGVDGGDGSRGARGTIRRTRHRWRRLVWILKTFCATGGNSGGAGVGERGTTGAGSAAGIATAGGAGTLHKEIYVWPCCDCTCCQDCAETWAARQTLAGGGQRTCPFCRAAIRSSTHPDLSEAADALARELAAVTTPTADALRQERRGRAERLANMSPFRRGFLRFFEVRSCCRFKQVCSPLDSCCELTDSVVARITLRDCRGWAVRVCLRGVGGLPGLAAGRWDGPVRSLLRGGARPLPAPLRRRCLLLGQLCQAPQRMTLCTVRTT